MITETLKPVALVLSLALMLSAVTIAQALAGPKNLGGGASTLSGTDLGSTR